MKAMKRLLTLAALCAFTGSAFAADPPAGTQPARRDPIKMQLFRMDSGRRPKMEKAAFLGVATSPAPAALTQQLKLQKGVGLVVDFVEPKSPGDEAGLKQYDVLQKLDDQLLIDAHQFAVLVRTFKPGDEVTLTVIHQGEMRTVKAKLIEREVVALDEPNQGVGNFMPAPRLIPGEGLPLIQSVGGSGGGAAGFGGPGTPPAFARWVDGAGALSWTRDGRTGQIIIQQTDKDGKKNVQVIKEDEIGKLPPDLRDRFEKMQVILKEHRPNGIEGGGFFTPATQPMISTHPETH